MLKYKVLISSTMYILVPHLNMFVREYGQRCMQPRNSSNNSNIMWSCAAAAAYHMHYFFNATVKNSGDVSVFLNFFFRAPVMLVLSKMKPFCVFVHHFVKKMFFVVIVIVYVWFSFVHRTYCCIMEAINHHTPYKTSLKRRPKKRKNNLSLTKTSREKKGRKKWKSEIFIHNRNPFLLL